MTRQAQANLSSMTMFDHFRRKWGSVILIPVSPPAIARRLSGQIVVLPDADSADRAAADHLHRVARVTPMIAMTSVVVRYPRRCFS
jgi:hypothetical protein